MLLDLLLPNRCLHCNRIIPAAMPVCEACEAQIHYTHWNFDGKNPLAQKCRMLFPTEKAFALMHFGKEGLSRELIHSLKYRQREILGKMLAERVAERIVFDDDKPQLIASVPLHPKKLRQRGYNQLHLFADALSEKWEIPHDRNLLKRNIHKKSQATSKFDERFKTQNLFSLTKTIENQHIMIVDDVFTTGNTMASIAWEFLKSEGNRVSVLVMAMD